MGSWADTDGLVGMELTQLWAAPSRGADAPDALQLSAGVRHTAGRDPHGSVGSGRHQHSCFKREKVRAYGRNRAVQGTGPASVPTGISAQTCDFRV